MAEIPETLAQLFLRSVEEFDLPDALNYRSDGEWKPISSAEMVERARNIALGLYSLGLRKGDRAAILASNSPKWTLADAGCQFAGVIDVPIYTTLAPDAVRYILDDSAARVLFLENEESYRRLLPTIENCASLEQIVLFGPPDGEAMALADLESSGAKLAIEQPGLCDELTGATGPDDIATLIYTSGTTGEPKGVMLSHSNLISNALDASERYAFAGRDIALSVLPLVARFRANGNVRLHPLRDARFLCRVDRKGA